MPETPFVHSHPEIVSGEPVFVGTRVPARSLLDWISGGHTVDEFLENFPSVRREQATGYLDQTRRSRLGDACDRLDPEEERALAEETLATDAQAWPEY